MGKYPMDLRLIIISLVLINFMEHYCSQLKGDNYYDE